MKDYIPSQHREKQIMDHQTHNKENPFFVPGRWMRVSEAAEYLRVSENFINKARQTRIPDIPFVRIGRRILYDRHALDAFLEARAGR
jgi:excisionase family DNA binding protein